MSDGQNTLARQIVYAHNDAIRTVPLNLSEELVTFTAEAGPATPPKLTYRGGALLSAVEVFTVFWGAVWQQSPQSDNLAKVNSFFDYILTSPLIDQLAEYSVPAFKIGHGKRTGTVTLTTPAIRRSISDSQIQHMLQQEITTNPLFPQPTKNTLYFFYLPPGVRVSQGGSQSCQGFCGYHNDIQGQVFYAVMPYPGCKGCTGQLSTLDALTATSSHELCESITDPIPGQGWYDDANGEIGDICAWKTTQLGGYLVQLEWSNQADSCK